MKIFLRSLFTALLFFSSIFLFGQIGKVCMTGAMRNVMWKGQLYATIQIDTISHQKNLYGLGPLEYLTGELMVVDGKIYRSVVVNNKTMKTEEVATAKAPFFVYSNQAAWETVSLPSSVKDLKELEKFIDDKAMNVDEPFVFKIEGKVEYADIHLVNLAKGSIVKSPDDAHKGQVNCQVQQTDVQIIGFFSRKHQAVFTHHDTFMHLHLITNDRKMMGHLDDFKMEPSQLKLLMPAK